ncbi:sensor domain-containing diguanylate cyclase [Fulvimarina sp. 2208YS6-2-32]|uniref:Sensor domain-containing diguanylate cyclase n=1 Tax=Fulvimarina uroteuthidis TaxID=3098149 RepID=A0ABU5HZR6_9HYPH|nr:sensor domain-containing diguanylate cyclase [Fulvimarina sp. 2208YS6-2-32]MDY8108631.1 sensor domain-containing diguanylate cyclase [Fulvimarina sp. 2208YS6-2-32]
MTHTVASPSSQERGEPRVRHADSTFAHAPVPLWLEDWSGVKALIDTWRREGVEDLDAHLAARPGLLKEAARAIRILDVNARTLSLLAAPSLAVLQDNLDIVFSGNMFGTLKGELCQLYRGDNGFVSLAVNYTLDREPLDIQVKGRIMPGHEHDWKRVLVSTEDVSDREESLRRLGESEAFSRGLFEHSPVSLWVEDFSKIRELLEDVKARGVSDFRTFVDVHPEFVERCMREIKVVDVNRHTIELFKASSKSELLARLNEVFRDDMRPHFKEQLIKLWEGELFHTREVINYDLTGSALHVHMQFSVFPGHERDWSLTQVALTDITARKKAEAYLEYLGKHDVLTGLRNRSFFDDELQRLERCGPHPVTVIVADLNGLKPVNDKLGHAAGDMLLRRAGEVLREAVSAPQQAARIGGDEFVVLMPATGEKDGTTLMRQIEKLVAINNKFYPGARLSFAMGLAVCEKDERLEDAVQRADEFMYEAKRSYYESSARNRRGVRAQADARP